MAGDKIITPDIFVLSRTEDTNSNAYSHLQGVFKACWDHLKYLETLGITTEIARNHGTAVNARGPGTGWWDEPTRFGFNGWSCFRWNSNSNRSWEWYMFIQNCDIAGPASPGLPGYTIPGLGNARGFCVAAAITLSGSVTGNPWGGTTGSLGSDTKGSPVWVSASNDYKLFVFPEANGASGVLGDGRTSTNREGLTGDFDFGGNSSHRRVSFISDNDSFIYLRNNDEANYSFGYLGLYEPFSIKNAEGVEDNDTPKFVGYWNWTLGVPWESSLDVGSLTVNGGDNEQGACILPHEADSQMRGIRLLTIPDPTIDDVHQMKYGGRLLNPTIPVHDATFSLRSAGVFESSPLYQGTVGRFDPSMMQIVIGAPTHARLTGLSWPKIVITPLQNDANETNSFALTWHPDAPFLEKRDRFGELRRYVVTSST